MGLSPEEFEVKQILMAGEDAEWRVIVRQGLTGSPAAQTRFNAMLSEAMRDLYLGIISQVLLGADGRRPEPNVPWWPFMAAQLLIDGIKKRMRDARLEPAEEDNLMHRVRQVLGTFFGPEGNQWNYDEQGRIVRTLPETHP